MNNLTFDLKPFLRDSVTVLVNPKNYFSAMKVSGGIIEPVLKALLYGLVSGIIVLLFSLLHIVTDSSGLFGAGFGFKMLGTYVIVSAIGLFICGGILLVLSSICKGNTGFEPNIRIAASVMVLLPVRAILGFAVGLNFYLGLVVLLLIGLVGLFLIYNALIFTLKAKVDLVKVVVPVFIAVFVLSLFFFGYEVWNKTNQFRKVLKNLDFKEMTKDLPKN
jgi:hypothetical protein